MKTRSLLLLAALASFAPRNARAGDEAGDALLLKGLATSRHALLDGIRAAGKAPAVALSAKFEDEGHGLSLSVYTAGKGLATEADENVLQELAGSPTGAEWKPATEVFKDVEHVARAAEQLTLMRQTKISLAAAVETAQGMEGGGTVFSITPKLRDGKSVFVVRMAVDGAAVTWVLDLATGLSLERIPVKPIPKEPSRVGQSLAEPVVGGGRWIPVAPVPLRELAAKKVVLVVSNSYL